MDPNDRRRPITPTRSESGTASIFHRHVFRAEPISRSWSDAAITRVQIMDGPLSSDSRSGNLSSGYRSTVLSHGGRGINVLYEDGHVGFLPTDSLDRIPDNPLVNHDGLKRSRGDDRRRVPRPELAAAVPPRQSTLSRFG